MNSSLVPTTTEFMEEFDPSSGYGTIVSGLTIKKAALVPHFSTEWMTEQLHLPHRTVEEVLWQLKEDRLVEILGQVGPLSYNYAITNKGIEFAQRMLSLCGYTGPAPVELSQYEEMVFQQMLHDDDVTLSAVNDATKDLVLDDSCREIAALAMSSGRSLFIFGPPGNGKSSLGSCLHNALQGRRWVPYAIAVNEQIIRVFDPQVHRVSKAGLEGTDYDHRWVPVERPLIVAGGEMTLDQLDLAYDEHNNYYEAPPHFKAMGGTFFIDDLGRQRVSPEQLLNRWILPLETNEDYLSFKNGQKVKVPFQAMLIVATNLQTREISDAAFLRRIGYRIFLDSPSEQVFRQIFMQHARRLGLEVDARVLEYVIQRYQNEGRIMRASEPRDLLLRCGDVCRLKNQQVPVNREIMDIAWTGYFSASSEFLSAS